jgi:hypothetical protein
MNPKRSTGRGYTVLLLLLSGVLLLGIVQWSFLPILIQNVPVESKAVLEVSAGHSSKFVAPFKGLFGDDGKPCRVQSGATTRGIAFRFVGLAENPLSRHDDFILSDRLLRAPPSA